MGKFLAIVAIVALGWSCFVMNEARKPKPMKVSVRADIEAAAAAAGCELLEYKEPQTNVVEFVVRGPTGNAVNDVLTKLGPPPEGSGVMKDVINYDDPKRYWIGIHQSNEAHYARHVVRAYKYQAPR